MKSIGFLLLLGVGIVGLLRTDLTPYKLMTKQELRELAAVGSARTFPAQVQSSSWLFDPQYRTALEKTTVIGVPEPSKRRER